MDTNTPPDTIRPATRADRAALLALIDDSSMAHIHPDWQAPLAWLDTPPFWVALRREQIVAALSTAPDPPDAAWVRVALVRSGLSPADTLTPLWEAVLAELGAAQVQRVAGLLTSEWLRPVVAQWGFELLCSMVVLQQNPQSFGMPPLPLPQARIRFAKAHDLDAITLADNTAFAPPWQHSRRFLHLAIQRTEYATVIEIDGQVIGYQFSTGGRKGGHLARLAIQPEWQGHGLGQALVADVVRHFDVVGAPRVTVNTQDTNHASLRLYEALDFAPTGDTYPVWQYMI